MSFGKILREKREEKKIKLETVASSIRIKADYLKAFEEEDFKNMPNEPFATGFLKNYINFLELNEEELYNLYLEIKKSRNKEDINKNFTSNGNNFNHNVDNSQKNKKFKKNEFSSNLKIRLVVLKDILRNNPQIKSMQKINFVNMFFVFIIILILFFVIFFMKTFTIICPFNKPKKIDFYQQNQKIAYNYVLEFKTTQYCWFKIEADGKLLFKDVIPSDQTRKWYADKNFNIIVGNIEAGTMLLNGEMVYLKKDRSEKKNKKIILDESTTGYWLLDGDVKE